MLPSWKIKELINLIQSRYPDWDNFRHPPFVADEIEYKQATVQKAVSLISQDSLDNLLAQGDFDTIMQRLDTLGNDNNLLWRQVPSAGDTAVLYHPDLDPPTFCAQMRNLLYGDRPSPKRLQTFSDYLASLDLPNKWPFATYFLFICHPNKELFVKPRTARWFVKFMGEAEPDETPPPAKELLSTTPGAASYATLLAQLSQLRQGLSEFGPQDMIDIQSFIWICAQESQKRTGRLDPKGQIDLDVPPSSLETPVPYEIASRETAVIYEERTAWLSDPYPLEACARDTGWPAATISRWVRAILRKGQAVIYGPPGTGKTYVARKLAAHLVAEGDGFVELVQFHPGYSYESFLQGLRPQTDASGNLHYTMVHGRFWRFCEEAATKEGLCVLIIDEINRANLASVFGELMYLLEYRNEEVVLAEGGIFRIPENVRIIGTMNTADRSIALVDHALRRRFAFIHLPPNASILETYHRNSGFDPVGLINIWQRINRQIGDPHYLLGITYFLQPDITNQLEDIWRMEIEPFLEEYFFDNPDQVDLFRWDRVRDQMLKGKG